MKTFTPALRSRPYGHRYLRAGRVVLIALVTLLVPSLLGLAIIAGASFRYVASDFDNPWTVISTIGGILLLAPVYGIFLVPFGLLLGAWAMRWGLAGWVYALGTAVALPMGIGALFGASDPTLEAWQAGVVLVPVTISHAAVMWMATRLLCPDALLDPLP
ncbi:hypothetical protein [Jannaschia sp. CCS1]|uniref:hypothetical protein n=1 Tax=Jannaschia sp. (strain CCS1) TaxID=290400 RepID=UPI000053AE92|nr:hypothetical protein [Jannaschia sp. CCS1]ABD56074.1 hypothetical protein Jann_3157 [Jannaschia sp. CCS1]